MPASFKFERHRLYYRHTYYFLGKVAERLMHQFAKLTTFSHMGSIPILSICLLRLEVRTLPFHGKYMGSNPIEGTFGVIA